jgi:catechol 2,3-dioxygenase-like lactoylglutathione lyase family enzyme
VSGPAIPILRIFDVPLAHRFYLEALGFSVDWEHRFEPEMPLYEQVSRDGILLHLSEHVGDGTPGSAVWIPVDDVRSLYEEFRAAPFEARKQNPGFHADGPGGPGFTVGDPFGNHLTFAQPPPASPK